MPGYENVNGNSGLPKVPPPPPSTLNHPFLKHLHAENQFFLYYLTPSERPDKIWGKKPVYEKVTDLMTAGQAQYLLGQSGSAELLPFPIGDGDYFYDLNRHKNPDTGLLTPAAAEAIRAYKSRLTNGYSLGYYFTEGSHRFFYDLDGCRNPETGELTPFAQAAFVLFTALGAYLEVSPSGTGLHIVGIYRGPRPAHRTDNTLHNLELYTADRGMAIGNAFAGTGSPDADCTEALTDLIANYFAPGAGGKKLARPWTTDPQEGWSGPTDKAELLEIFLRSHKDSTPTNRQLYEGDQTALAAWRSEPGRADGVLFDPTAGDMLYASRWNFQDGNNFELTLEMMENSPYAELRRDKWKSGVLRRETIAKAYSEEVYNPGGYRDPNKVFGKGQRPDNSIAEGEPPAPAAAAKPTKKAPAPLGADAFHGVVGDFARLVEPSTEGDINALVVAFLTAFGCLYGREPHLKVEDTRHGLNLFSVIVGESSKARKGTVTDRVMNMLELTCKDFVEKRLHNGLSTGEGLIYCVRDPREDSGDAGVEDKRLLALESEFASVLDHGKRDGNILSAIMRNAWDGKALRIMAKTNKDSCQRPHISLIGNITVDELQRCLSDKDRSNGFGNRILWAYAKRSKLLSRPKRVPEHDLQTIANRLSGVLFNMSDKELTWSDSAAELWDEEYARLGSETHGGGLVDTLTARAEAQVLRIALIYAVLDRSRAIQVEHLRAALEVWRYCAESVAFIFGNGTGDQLAEDMLSKLLAKPEGMTQTELSAAFNRKKTANELRVALEALVGLGKVRSEERSQPHGRKVTVWLTA